MANKIIWVFVIIFIFVILMASRVFFTQMNFINMADKFYNKKEYIRSADNYEKALQFYLPYSPYNRKSIERLIAIARLYKKKHLIKHELYAFQLLRSSLYATRSFYTPYRNIINIINKKIASIEANDLIKAGYKNTYKQTYNNLMYIMKKDLAPNPMWALFSILSFFGWIMSIILMVVLGIRENKLLLAKIFLFFIMYTAFFGFFIFSLYMV